MTRLITHFAQYSFTNCRGAWQIHFACQLVHRQVGHHLCCICEQHSQSCTDAEVIIKLLKIQAFVSQASLFLEEMASIVLTPFVLYFSLPYCTHAILDFVRDNTVFVEGVGDICSLANFDFEKHGNSKYGALTHCPKVTINMLLLP